MKKILVLLLSLFLPFMVNAASISVSGTTSISPGESKTLSLIVNSSKPIYGGQVNFALDSDDFEILISKSTTSYGSIVKNSDGILVYSTDKKIPAKGTLAKIVVKAKSNATVGATANLVLKNVILSVKDGDKFVDEDASNYTKVLTVAEPKSTNNYLKSLEIEGHSIEFDKDQKTYNINIAKGTTKLNITAIAEDEKAKVTISGNTKLGEGKNVITVTVTAENGSKRVYTINATAPVASEKNTDCDLKTLEIKGYNITFDPNKTEYRVNVPNTTTKIEINSTLVNPESTKKTDGPATLSVGENTYVITVTDKAGNTKTYKIIVNRAEAEKECDVCEVCEECEEKTDNIWKTLAIILVIVTLAETIYMVTMRDRKQI